MLYFVNDVKMTSANEDAIRSELSGAVQEVLGKLSVVEQEVAYASFIETGESAERQVQKKYGWSRALPKDSD